MTLGLFWSLLQPILFVFIVTWLVLVFAVRLLFRLGLRLGLKSQFGLVLGLRVATGWGLPYTLHAAANPAIT